MISAFSKIINQSPDREVGALSILLFLRLLDSVELLVEFEELFLGKGNVHHTHHACESENCKAAHHLHKSAISRFEIDVKSTGFLLAALLVSVHLLLELETDSDKPKLAAL